LFMVVAESRMILALTAPLELSAAQDGIVRIAITAMAMKNGNKRRVMI
jgi:hypothetical protein